MSAYTYEIVYTPTAKHGNADGLSRLPCGFDPQFESGHALVELVEYEVFGTLPASVVMVKEASKRDAVLSSVIDDVCKGKKLNKNVNIKDGEVTAFCRREAELTVCDGVLIWGSRVVVPKVLRERLLKELHAVHSGIVRMKSLAREYFWWPGILLLLVVVVNVKKVGMISKRCLSILGSFRIGLGNGHILIRQVQFFGFM